MTTTTTTSTNKVRRDASGGKRGDGHRRFRRIRRPDPRLIRKTGTDARLTAFGGLSLFGAYLRELGVDRQLREQFGAMKTGHMVVYPMEAQLRLLLDSLVLGEDRVFGLESLAADPLFVRLAGGVVPSLDTVYRDLARFDEARLSALELLVSQHGLASLQAVRNERIHIDIDTTVEPLFGTQQGALPGPNPRYHGRPSYHPILATIAETRTAIAAELRPGDTGFGDAQAPFVGRCIDRMRAHAPHAILCVRIDAAADCAAIMSAIAERDAWFFIKARIDQELCNAVTLHKSWRTVDVDAHGHAITQIAEIAFLRPCWVAADLNVRVIARRTRDHTSGQLTYLWDDEDWTTQVFLTNDSFIDAADVPFEYNGRAGIEPLIGELKHAWGIGKIPSEVFVANHAMFLLKLLAHNLLRRFVRQRCPAMVHGWRTEWIRRVLLRVPGRLTRSSRRWGLRLPPLSLPARMVC